MKWWEVDITAIITRRCYVAETDERKGQCITAATEVCDLVADMLERHLKTFRAMGKREYARGYEAGRHDRITEKRKARYAAQKHIPTPDDLRPAPDGPGASDARPDTGRAG